MPPLVPSDIHSQLHNPCWVHLQVACFCQQLVHLLFQEHQPRKQASGSGEKEATRHAQDDFQRYAR